jgi:hypothetical protein
LGFARRGAADWWEAYERSRTVEAGGPVIPNRWVIGGVASTRLRTNRYLHHRVFGWFSGTCTLAQRTTSRTARALVAAVRDQVVRLRVRPYRAPSSLAG